MQSTLQNHLETEQLALLWPATWRPRRLELRSSWAAETGWSCLLHFLYILNVLKAFEKLLYPLEVRLESLQG